MDNRDVIDRCFNAASGLGDPTGAQGWGSLSVSWIRPCIWAEESLSLSLPKCLRWGRIQELPRDRIPKMPLKIPISPRQLSLTTLSLILQILPLLIIPHTKTF